MPLVLGRHHPLIRRLRRLRRDAALRREEGVYLSEGLHLAREALRRQAAIELFVISPALERHAEGPALVQRVRELGLPCESVGDSVLGDLQDARSPQPVLALLRRPERRLDDCLSAGRDDAFFVVAVGLQDPGNLGAMLRTADAAGASAFFAAGTSADLYHPRAVRAGMGSHFALPTMQVELAELQGALSRRGIRSAGSDPREGTDYRRAALDPPLALFLGGEGAGLEESLLAGMELRLRIPMQHGVESLSVNAAATLLAFEIARRRGEE